MTVVCDSQTTFPQNRSLWSTDYFSIHHIVLCAIDQGVYIVLCATDQGVVLCATDQGVRCDDRGLWLTDHFSTTEAFDLQTTFLFIILFCVPQTNG